MFGLPEISAVLILIIVGVLIIQCILWFMVPFFINTMNNNIKKIVKQLKIITNKDKKN